MIRDQVVDKWASNSLRRKLLRETDLHWMGFYRSLDQSKHLTYMLCRQRPGRSTRFVVGLKDQMRKTGEVHGRVDQRM